jgi:hypothetical protein
MRDSSGLGNCPLNLLQKMLAINEEERRKMTTHPSMTELDVEIISSSISIRVSNFNGVSGLTNLIR